MTIVNAEIRKCGFNTGRKIFLFLECYLKLTYSDSDLIASTYKRVSQKLQQARAIIIVILFLWNVKTGGLELSISELISVSSALLAKKVWLFFVAHNWNVDKTCTKMIEYLLRRIFTIASHVSDVSLVMTWHCCDYTALKSIWKSMRVAFARCLLQKLSKRSVYSTSNNLKHSIIRAISLNTAA